jgi:hypothetical protein
MNDEQVDDVVARARKRSQKIKSKIINGVESAVEFGLHITVLHRFRQRRKKSVQNWSSPGETSKIKKVSSPFFHDFRNSDWEFPSGICVFRITRFQT